MISRTTLPNMHEWRRRPSPPQSASLLLLLQLLNYWKTDWKYLYFFEKRNNHKTPVPLHMIIGSIRNANESCAQLSNVRIILSRLQANSIPKVEFYTVWRVCVCDVIHWPLWIKWKHQLPIIIVHCVLCVCAWAQYLLLLFKFIFFSLFLFFFLLFSIWCYIIHVHCVRIQID